jgi:hypothetical protein
MSNILRRAVRFLNLLPPERSGPDLVASLAAIAMIQARFVAAELRENVVPALLTSQRVFPDMMARRLESGDIFRPDFVNDLEALADVLGRAIDAGAHLGWEGDEHHVHGGYEVVCYHGDVVPLVDAVNALDDLRHAVLATLSAAKAIRSVDDLLAN